ncbi:hypothetical protein XI03_04965 [Bradyrhizobium sp. CCBAU 65884]|uniref:hypothetical protein n=1 Tax=Bradyrhizobium sp. CCBAU 65884 TaxID=722477 RepID=UPI002304F4DD|nr:hypothetical protein [Bradyrhizobium sp. CCBAU 65884]MDA9473876.1 hypothetical protein [Bradyrhizobium sp. CCBAU 65884]
MSWSDAHNALSSLGYRDQAFKIELLELDKARARRGTAVDPSRLPSFAQMAVFALPKFKLSDRKGRDFRRVTDNCLCNLDDLPRDHFR